MKVAAFNDWYRWGHLIRDQGVDVRPFEKESVELVVRVDTLYFDQQGERNRPTLRMAGRVTEAYLEHVLDFGLETIGYEPDCGPMVSGTYEFSHEQLAELVRRGYFESDYSIPKGLRGIEYSLPATMSGSVIAPAGVDDVPLLFADVDNAGDLGILNQENTGYDLVEYMPVLDLEGRYSTPEVPQTMRHEAVDHDQQILVSGDELFGPEVSAEDLGDTEPQEGQVDREPVGSEQVADSELSDALAGYVQERSQQIAQQSAEQEASREESHRLANQVVEKMGQRQDPESQERRNAVLQSLRALLDAGYTQTEAEEIVAGGEPATSAPAPRNQRSKDWAAEQLRQRRAAMTGQRDSESEPAQEPGL